MDTYNNIPEDVWTDDDQDNTETRTKTLAIDNADSLLTFKEPLRWYLTGLALYALAIFAVLGWAFSGPTYTAWSIRVLPTGNVKVDQFYAGIASVGFLVPAAALISQVCLEFGLLHPFSIAHTVPVSAADLDKMIDTGPFALMTVWKYSRRRALMQALLMLIGTVMVPVSSLILSTGGYAPQTHHHDVVGSPTYPSNLLSMSANMGYSGSGEFTNRFDDKDFVLTMISDTYKGYVISRRGLLNIAPNELGPVSTINMTFSPGVRYDGVVSFNWTSGCEAANDEITYTIANQGGDVHVNFTFPDGTVEQSQPGDLPFYMWTNATRSSSGIPLGGTTYIAQHSLIRNYTVNSTDGEEGITNVEDGTWISRVKCTPKMSWQVSSCIAHGDTMVNCTATPGKNTTGLDTVALDALYGYMTAVPWLLYLRNDYTFRMTLEPFYIMPTTGHYERILGVLAQSIVAITTAGYFGTATVPTVGEPLKSVYVVRIYVLFIIFGLLSLVLLLSAADLLYSRHNRLPFRKATFLTIAYAVHGRGVDWDEGCGCVMSRKKLRKGNQMKLRYGIDVKDRFHVGLASDVRTWECRDEEKSQESSW